MSKNLINTVVSTVKNFISGGDTTPKMEIPDNSDFLKYMYAYNDGGESLKAKYIHLVSIPAIAAGERAVLSFDLGKLTRSDYVMFFPLINLSYSADQFDLDFVVLGEGDLMIPKTIIGGGNQYTILPYMFIHNATGQVPYGIKINDDPEFAKGFWNVNLNSNYINNKISGYSFLGSSLVSTYDYKKCCRARTDMMEFPNSNELINSNDDKMFGTKTGYEKSFEYRKFPWTYENLNKGCIFGFYSYDGSITGVFKTDKKVILESSWLELLADGTTELKIALKNLDSTANTAVKRHMLVYNI